MPRGPALNGNTILKRLQFGGEWPDGRQFLNDVRGRRGMAMTRACLRVTHPPVALVFSEGRFALVVMGRGLPFVGGLNLAHAAEAMISDSADFSAFHILETAFDLTVG
jgi:hypothetical protein